MPYSLNSKGIMIPKELVTNSMVPFCSHHHHLASSKHHCLMQEVVINTTLKDICSVPMSTFFLHNPFSLS